MRYKNFGITGMTVSEMTLGTWGMGGVGWDNYDEETKADAIKTAIDCGVNFIDTAPAYNGGEAERFLGRTLERLGVRNKIRISTKCGNVFVDGVVYRRDGRYDKIIEQCEESLKNLRTDYIDLMLIHWPDPDTPFEETMRALNKLKTDGKILHIGVSNFSIGQMKEISQFGVIEAFQPHYSMVNRDSEDLMKYAAGKGMGVMTYGSLGGGILTGKIREYREYAPSDSRNRFYKHFKEPMFSKVMKLLRVMDGISEKNGGVALSQIALNWSAQKDIVSTCIVGAQTSDKIRENCAAFDWKLSPEDIATLDSVIEQLNAE
ncbi:MAG: aldo/keto reductase [Oscillospiraceae bacterium]|nr:aldo/keto reductase [Oscillospiraceae bacterium]